MSKGNIRSLRYLLRYLRPHGKDMAIVLVALVVGAASVLSLGAGLRYLVDEGFSKQTPGFLDISLLVLIGIIFVLAAASYTRFYYITKIGESVVAAIRHDVYQKLLTLSPGFFEQTRSGEVLSRLTTDTSVIQLVVGSSLSIALRNTLLLVGGIVMLVATSAKLTTLILIVVPLIVLYIIRLGRQVRVLSRASQDKIAEVSAQGQETLDAMKLIQAYGQETQSLGKFSQHVATAFAAAMARVKMRARLTALVIVLAFSSIGLVLWIGGKDVIAGTITAGQLSSFVFYSALVAGAVAAISEVIGDMQRAAGASERLLELLHTESEIHVPEQPVLLSREHNAGSIAFEKVTFSYSSRPETPALREVSFDIRPGETVALVGPSGAGKSTILQLLLRFYDPQQGKITLDGVDVRDTDPKNLRELFAFVPQDCFVFADTARNNIRFGRPEASDEEVAEAAKTAMADDFIRKLPQGYDTFLGEKGVRLSGGERQRIALARALVRQPKILLLDEATNALDAENEQYVQEALEKVMARCTTLVIAHRLSTVLKADKIMVIEHGRIVAMGTHDELVKQGALYARLAEIQLSRAG